jgi:hypothetical protein
MTSNRFLLNAVPGVVTCFLLPQTAEAHRQYAAQHRRFLQRDPLGQSEGAGGATDNVAMKVRNSRVTDAHRWIQASASVTLKAGGPTTTDLAWLTAGYLDGVNRYEYSRSGPMSRMDPSGCLSEYTCKCWCNDEDGPMSWVTIGSSGCSMAAFCCRNACRFACLPCHLFPSLTGEIAFSGCMAALLLHR